MEESGDEWCVCGGHDASEQANPLDSKLESRQCDAKVTHNIKVRAFQLAPLFTFSHGRPVYVHQRATNAEHTAAIALVIEAL